jgi:hypothetical protein
VRPRRRAGGSVAESSRSVRGNCWRRARTARTHGAHAHGPVPSPKRSFVRRERVGGPRSAFDITTWSRFRLGGGPDGSERPWIVKAMGASNRVRASSDHRLPSATPSIGDAPHLRRPASATRVRCGRSKPQSRALVGIRGITPRRQHVGAGWIAPPFPFSDHEGAGARPRALCRGRARDAPDPRTNTSREHNAMRPKASPAPPPSTRLPPPLAPCGLPPDDHVRVASTTRPSSGSFHR